MDEPRGEQPTPSPRTPMVAAGATLSPVQQAYGQWTGHALKCPICRDVDGGRCDTADMLWRAYQASGKRAFELLEGETA
jgi:hypothetical protein